MFEIEELFAVAYKKERLLGRRLAKGASIPEETALVEILTKAAGAQTLAELIEARRAAQTRFADATRERAERRAERSTRRTIFETTRVDTTKWTGWFDGSALPNPGRIGIGAVLRSPRGETFELSAAAGHGDSSAAEYRALIALLETALREGARDVTIYGDSRVVIDDMLATQGAGIRSLAHYAARARTLIGEIGDVRLQWIPRARNADADLLSRQALMTAAAA